MIRIEFICNDCSKKELLEYADFSVVEEPIWPHTDGWGSARGEIFCPDCWIAHRANGSAEI